MGSTVFRNPRALSSALAALGTLQPRALGFLNTVDPLDTVSNCYIDIKIGSDPLVGAKMSTDGTCLDTWHVNVTPQVWVSQCCCNHQGVPKALLALTPEIKVLRQHKGCSISTPLVLS